MRFVGMGKRKTKKKVMPPGWAAKMHAARYSTAHEASFSSPQEPPIFFCFDRSCEQATAELGEGAAAPTGSPQVAPNPTLAASARRCDTRRSAFSHDGSCRLLRCTLTPIHLEQGSRGSGAATATQEHPVQVPCPPHTAASLLLPSTVMTARWCSLPV